MAFPQVYYTSCTEGLRRTKGFQVNAATCGIEQSLLLQVERLGVYIPPLSAPTRPGPDEIAHFPVSLLFQPIADGHAIVAQAKYIGADYSGRFGNYFTHSLISEQPRQDFRDFLPIELWRSPSWMTRESPTTTLPPLSQPQARAAIDPSRVQEFLREGGRLQHLTTFVAAIQQALATRRRIIIVDESEVVAHWIAAGVYALPRHIALQLSFNTYVKNPYQADALVVGTTPDSDFKFAPHEIEHQYFVFDFVGSRFTRTVQLSPFAQTTKAAFEAGRAEDVAGFGQFVERVAPDLPLDELDVALACYAHVVRLPALGVDAANILLWCAGRLSGFDAGALEAVLTGVLDTGACRVEILDAYDVLHRAAVADETNEAKRTAVEKPYVEWLLTTAASTASADIFARAIPRVAFGAPVVAHARSLRASWFAQVRDGPTDRARLGALLELGDRLGYLAESGEVAQRLGETVFGPALSQRPVQVALLAIAAGSAGRDVVRGVGAYLATRVGEPATFVELGPTLSEPLIAGILEDYAQEQRSVGLYLRLAAAKVGDGPGARVRRFRDCLDAVRDFGVALQADHFANAFDAFWQDRVPTVDEALQLLASLDGATISRTEIPRRLAHAALGVSDVRRPAAAHEQLIAKLGSQPLYGALGDAAPLVDAFTIAARLARPDGDHIVAIQEAIDCSRAIPDVMAEDLLELAARRLFESPVTNRHRDLLAHANTVDPARFLRLYANAAAAYLAERRHPGHVAQLFRVWTTVEPGCGSTLIEQVLPRALKGWHRKELSQVAEALSVDAAALGRWLRWSEDFAGEGAPRRLKHWFFLGWF